MFNKVLCTSLLISSMVFSSDLEIAKHKAIVQQAIDVSKRIRNVANLKENAFDLIQKDACLESVFQFASERTEDFLTESYWINMRFEAYKKRNENSLKAWSELSQEATQNCTTIAFLLPDVVFLETEIQN